jgi:hypothetical protein
VNIKTVNSETLLGSGNIVTAGTPPDDVTIEINDDDELQVKDGGVSTAKIADGAVTAAKLAEGAAGPPPDDVTIEINDDDELQVKDGGVSTDKIADGAVTDAKIGTRTLTDAAEDGTLTAVAAKNLTPWLQGLRDNLKYVFNKALFKNSGIEWSTVPLDGAWLGAAYGNGKFVAVASNGKTAYSTDGITWSVPAALAGNWQGVTYGDGKFVAVASDGKTAYSTDGISWTTVTLAGT